MTLVHLLLFSVTFLRNQVCWIFNHIPYFYIPWWWTIPLPVLNCSITIPELIILKILHNFVLAEHDPVWMLEVITLM